MHVSTVTCKTKRFQFCNNYDNSIITSYLTYCAQTSDACRHPIGNAYPCVTVGMLLHVRTCKATVVLDLENG